MGGPDCITTPIRRRKSTSSLHMSADMVRSRSLADLETKMTVAEMETRIMAAKKGGRAPSRSFSSPKGHLVAGRRHSLGTCKSSPLPPFSLRSTNSPTASPPHTVGGLRGSLTPTSSPDLQKVPVKLVPLPDSHRGKKDPTRCHLSEKMSWDGYNWDGTQMEVDYWATAALSSLERLDVASARRNEKKKSKFIAISGRSPQKEDNQEGPSVKQNLEKDELIAAVKMDSVEGGPTVGEAFARLLSGSDGFPETELQRMYCAFCRFKPVGMSEVSKDDLPRVLLHLNYIIPDTQLVHRLADNCSQFATMDFEDFEHFTMKYAAVEKEQLRKAYEQSDTGKREEVSCSKLPAIMTKLGLVPLSTSINDIMASLCMKDTTLLKFTDFLRFLAAYNAREAFTPSHLFKLKKVFLDVATEASGPTEKPSLKASRTVLADALLQAFGENIHSSLEHLLEHTYWDSAKSSTISLHEFVIWAHRLQEMEIRKFRCFFCSADADRDGFISLNELLGAMQKAGFTLFHQVVDEILAETGNDRETNFDFTNFFGFANACQKRDGFNSKELQNLVDAYKKHDSTGTLCCCGSLGASGSGMNNFELADLMRYLGYDIHLQDVHRYMKQVDFNGNGSMDFGEFLRLRRLHREEELSRLQRIFEDNKDNESGKLEVTDLEMACEEAGTEPEEHHLASVLTQIGNPEKLSFEDFVQVFDASRQRAIELKRQRAGFSEREFTCISNLWQKYNTSGNGKLEKGNLILLLIDAGVPMNQAEERARVFEMLGEARTEALKSGISQQHVGRPKSARLTFWPLVHLLRALLRMGERNTILREDQAVVETGFDRREVNEFRDLFLECGRWAAHGDGPTESEPNFSDIASNRNSRKLSRRATIDGLPSAPQDASEMQEHVQHEPDLTLKDLLSGNVHLMRAHSKSIQVILSRKLNMRFNMEQREALEHQVLRISGNDEDALDFADFLRLMSWILTTNFASINDVAKSVAEEVTKTRREAARARMRNAGMVVRTTIRWQNALNMKRRSSV